MRSLRERRRELEDRFGRSADASDASRSDAQWQALYARAARTGLLVGFGSGRTKWNTFPTAGRPRLALADLEREMGLPPSALHPRPPASERNRLVSQWALGCQWALLAAAAYALVRTSLCELADMRPYEAHSWGICSLVVEHALLGSPLTRAAVSALNRDYESRLASHEAGHFLAAFLLGLPVTGYRLLCPSGLPKTAFLHPQLNAEEAFSNGRVTDDAIGRLGIVLMAGIAAEALDHGRADGGASDEAMLLQLTARVRPEWRRAQTVQLGLWSSCEAVRLLREHRTAHARLAEAMRRGAPLGACLAILSDALSAPDPSAPEAGGLAGTYCRLPEPIYGRMDGSVS